MLNTYRKKTDDFFYNNYYRAWPGAKHEEMVPIYIAEMDSLLYMLEEGYSYRQEFARDYRLAQQLRVEVDGVYQPVQKQPSPYAIVPAQGIVLFQESNEIVYQCSYQRCYQILKFYIQQLQQRFPAESSGKNWEERLEALKKGRWKAKLEGLAKKLRFWDDSIGDPDAHFEGAKRLELNPGDIASFRQLRCQDTLRSLSVNGLIKAKDLEVLGEYKQLKTLYLRQMGIQDIQFLASLENLDELGLQGNQITDLSPLGSLKKLTHLYIADNPASDFSVVEQMPALKTLYADIEQLPDQLAWDAIPERIALRVLELTPLEKCAYHAEIVYKRQVPHAAVSQPKTEQPEDPRRLNIKDRWLYSGLINALGYPPAVRYDLTKLKQLDCSDHIPLCDDFLFLTEIGDYSCLAAATKLRELNLSGRVVKDFSWLKNCVNLRKLNLSNTDFADLSLLSEMKNLTSLSLAGCRNLKEDSFQYLKGMTKLRMLDLSNTNVRDPEILRGIGEPL